MPCERKALSTVFKLSASRTGPGQRSISSSWWELAIRRSWLAAELQMLFQHSHIFYWSENIVTLDFSSLLKNHFECLLQSSNVCFEVRSEYLRWLNCEQFDWLNYYGSQSELAKLAHRKLSERNSKQTLELCNEHSELTNEHSNWFFKSELKSRVKHLFLLS